MPPVKDLDLTGVPDPWIADCAACDGLGCAYCVAGVVTGDG